jgi:heme/copper-type cytochrome/quinol oxidase subunit 1
VKKSHKWTGIISAYIIIGLMHALYFDSMIRDIFGPDNGPEWAEALLARTMTAIIWPLVWLDKLL